MNVRPGRQAARLVAALLYASITVALFTTPAIADDVVGDAVDQTGETLGETVEDTTDAVGDTVEVTTDAVGETVEVTTDAVGGTVDDTTDAVGESVDTVTEGVADTTAGSGDLPAGVGDAVTQANGSTNDVARPLAQTGNETGSSGGSAGASGGSNGGTSGGRGDRDRERARVTETNERSRPDALGAEEWVWEPSDRLESTWANVPPAARIGQVVAAEKTDPCVDDPSLVCLGLLYGIGRYANFFSSVLGVLATTGFGFGIIGLMAIALALGTSGSAALVVARGCVTPTVGRR